MSQSALSPLAWPMQPVGKPAPQATVFVQRETVDSASPQPCPLWVQPPMALKRLVPAISACCSALLLGIAPPPGAMASGRTPSHGQGYDLTQVTSMDHFPDVDSNHWAYDELKKLVETYQCVAGYPRRHISWGAARHPLRDGRPASALPGPPPRQGFPSPNRPPASICSGLAHSAHHNQQRHGCRHPDQVGQGDVKANPP